MNRFRIKTIFTLVVVTALAAVASQLFLALFVVRDFGDLARNVPIFSVIVGALEIAGALALWTILRPLHDASRAIARGESIPTAERDAGRAAAGRVPGLVTAVTAIGFFVGPLAGIAVNASSGRLEYTLGKALLVLAANASVGFVATLQTILMIDGQLRAPLATLAFHDLPKDAKRGSFRGKMVMVTAVCAVGLGLLLPIAAYCALDAQKAGAAIDPAGFLLQILGLALILSLWALSIAWDYARTLSRSANSVAGRITDVAIGEGDLTVRASVTGNGEYSRLAAAFNLFLDRLNGLIGRVRELSGSVLKGAEALAGSSEQASRSVGGLEESMSAVRQAVEKQSETVGGAEGEIARMLDSIERVASKVEDQSGFVDQSSAAVAEMAANIASVSRVAAKADELARRLRETSDEGGQALRDSLASVAEIEAASKAVRDIIGVISKIAAQTNLLAMNAAIEAAHAGEAGRGFAVVADEVRGLAESAAKSAREIEGLIKGMAGKIDRSADLADRAGKSFDRIREGVAETGELVQTIAASMSEQQAGAEEILRSVDSLTEATRVIRGLTAEQKAGSKAMEQSMLRIVGASNEIFEAVQEETGATQSLGRVVALVGEEAERNRQLVRGLEGAVSQFKTGS